MVQEQWEQFVIVFESVQEIGILEGALDKENNIGELKK